MSEWKEVKLGEVCDIKHGYAFKGEFFTNDYQPYVITTPANFCIGGGFKMADKPKYYKGDIPKEYILKEKDLIVTMTDLSKNGDTLGFSALIPSINNCVFLHNQRIGLVENVKEEIIDKYFLYWLMRTRNYQKFVVGSASGTTVKHTSPNRIGNYTTKIPPLDTQRRISSILSALDDKIECNNKICKNLEEQAQALFKHWFVDFAPFKDGKFVESELGLIPEGWKVGTLGEICKCELGGTPSRSIKSFWNGNIAWINSGAVNKFRICEASEYITEEGLKHSSTKLLPKKTTVLAITGATLGQVSLLEIDSCANQSVIGIKENKNFSHSFIYPLINYKIKHIMQMQTGGAQQHINKDNVQSLKIVICPNEIMQKYKSITEYLYEQIGNICFENKTLSNLRDSLLPKLMSGQIQV